MILYLDPHTTGPTDAELLAVMAQLPPNPFAGCRNCSTTQFSIARYYGGAMFTGHGYPYLNADDSLWRDDVLRAVLKLRQASRQAPAQPEPTQEPLL